MARTVAEIELEISSLTEEDRVSLMGYLSETLRKPTDPQIEAAIQTELRKRLSMLETGEARWVDGDQALTEIEARLHPVASRSDQS